MHLLLFGLVNFNQTTALFIFYHEFACVLCWLVRPFEISSRFFPTKANGLFVFVATDMDVTLSDCQKLLYFWLLTEYRQSRQQDMTMWCTFWNLLCSISLKKIILCFGRKIWCVTFTSPLKRSSFWLDFWVLSLLIFDRVFYIFSLLVFYFFLIALNNSIFSFLFFFWKYGIGLVTNVLDVLDCSKAFLGYICNSFPQQSCKQERRGMLKV